MCFDQLLPIFLSTEPPDQPTTVRLPFQFVGGFGFDNQTIGLIMSTQGLYSVFVSLLIFPWAVRHMGNLRVFQLLAGSYFVHYLATPYFVLLPDQYRMVSIWFLVLWKCTFAQMAFPTSAVLLRSASKGSLWMGTINGAAASAASLCRAFGPVLSGMLYARGLDTGYIGLPWWFGALVAVIGGVIALGLEEDKHLDDVETGRLLPPPAGGEPSELTAAGSAH